MADVNTYLHKYGLIPKDADLPEIRALLAKEAELERNGEERTFDLALLCCIQLSSRGLLEDVLRIWDAKMSSFDLYSYLDTQFLCGPGLAQTKKYLKAMNDTEADAALAYIIENEEAGTFDDDPLSSRLEFYKRYFSEDE